MPDNTDPIPGWNSTDEAGSQPVPVRASEPAKAPVPAQPTPAWTTAPEQTPHQTHTEPKTKPMSVPINPPRTRSLVPAVLGIVIATGLIGTFYLGIDGLRGQLSGTTPDTGNATVTITADGDFDPATITVAPGQTLTFVNENSNPQVLKSKTDDTLFDVQVLFTDPIDVVIPDDAGGKTYTYYSETLDASKTLTITVGTEAAGSSSAAATSSSAAASSAPASSSSSDSNLGSNDLLIPLPDDLFAGFGSSSSSSAPAVVAISSSAPAAPAPKPLIPPQTKPQAQERYNSVIEQASKPQAATFTLHQAAGAASSDATVFNSDAIPTNPYTVGNALQNPNAVNASILKNARNQQQLHSGAPSTPRTSGVTTETGPQFWMLGLLAISGVVVVYKKTRKA